LHKLYKEYGNALIEIGMQYKLPIGLDKADLNDQFANVLKLMEL
jgi:hypothetical protein